MSKHLKKKKDGREISKGAKPFLPRQKTQGGGVLILAPGRPLLDKYPAREREKRVKGGRPATATAIAALPVCAAKPRLRPSRHRERSSKAEGAN